jgi:enamine deaminase RidA (YjgF/YER057c/UK114 family)
MPVEVVNPSGIYKPATYFQASISTGSRLVCLSGQVGIDEQGNLVGPDDLAAQTEQAYRNVYFALRELGANFLDVAKLMVYAVDWSPTKMGLLLSGATKASSDLGFDFRRPLTLLGVTGLARPEWLVEVEAMAVLP